MPLFNALIESIANFFHALLRNRKIAFMLPELNLAFETELNFVDVCVHIVVAPLAAAAVIVEQRK